MFVCRSLESAGKTSVYLVEKNLVLCKNSGRVPMSLSGNFSSTSSR